MALPIHIATVQYAQSSAQHSGAVNEDTALHLTDDAAHTADLVLLPETSFIAYRPGMNVRKLAQPDRGPNTAIISQIATTRNAYICFSIIEQDGDRLYKTAILVSADGEVVGKQRKMNLTEIDRQAGFSPGESLQVFRTHVGDLGILVGRDVRDHEKAHRLDQAGAQLILAVFLDRAAAPRTVKSMAERSETALRYCALHSRCYVAWANKIGSEDSLTEVGSSMILDPDGNVIARGSFDQEEIVRARVNLLSKDLVSERRVA